MFSHYDSWRDKALVVCIYIFVVLVTLAFIYPFWDQMVMSLSTRADAMKHELRLFPRPISLTGYSALLGSRDLVRAFSNTVFRVIAGTSWTLFVTALAAYPLSRPECPFRKFWVVFLLFTMMFGGGLIPNYLLRVHLNLIDKFAVLIVPGVSAWNVIIMRNFFQALPAELQEAAKLDGASDLGVLWRVILPLSKPVMATIGLWSAVGHWNSYFDVLIYIHDRNKYTIQVLLRRVLLEGQMSEMDIIGVDSRDWQLMERPTPETVKAALLIVATVPILVVYPFAQRYFVKGIMVGSVKG